VSGSVTKVANLTAVVRDWAALILALVAIGTFTGQWYDLKNRITNVENAVNAQMSQIQLQSQLLELKYQNDLLTVRVAVIEQGGSNGRNPGVSQ
jgi:predicted Zn-dependent protease